MAVSITFADGSDGEVQAALSDGSRVHISQETQMPVILEAGCKDTDGQERLKISGISGRLILDQIVVKCI